MRMRKRDDEAWKSQFGLLLRHVFERYEISYSAFSGTYHMSSSTVRYWFGGRNLPNKVSMAELKEYLRENLIPRPQCDEQTYEEVRTLLDEWQVAYAYYALRRRNPAMNTFIGEALELYRSFAKHDFTAVQQAEREVKPTGRTQAVVFDFDGTLTRGDTNRTTWESIWESLGYGVKPCQELYRRFENREINHTEWCVLTEQRFSERKLHRQNVEEIADNIRLIDGVEETFRTLQKKNIRVYILSGSVDVIIRRVLGALTQYVDEVKANIFRFNDNGFLNKIVETKYDFEGKPDFIDKVASELNVSPCDILFVGDSANDRYVHLSGARTLCINPKMTDPTDKTVWTDWIHSCTALCDVLKYL